MEIVLQMMGHKLDVVCNLMSACKLQKHFYIFYIMPFYIFIWIVVLMVGLVQIAQTVWKAEVASMETALNIPILVFVNQVGMAIFVINQFACKYEV